ncbi:MAG: RNA polymerase sigma factor [Paramuribaculum sp.]|nr:RNA polymerase sigma factor [Paramuribaculum sp.]
MFTTNFIRNLTDYMEARKQSLFRYVCYRIGNPADAEDLLQEVYLQIADAPERKVENLAAYVYRTLSNACSTYIKMRRECQVALDCEEVMALSDETSDFEEEYRRIDRLLSSIPSEQSEVIRLKIHAQMTFDEVAQAASITASTAKRRYYNGLELLRQKLKDI